MFNIFNILAAADKELVHSSMIKFLLENKHLNCFFPKLKQPLGEIGIEILGKVKEGEKPKLLRFDIVGYSKETPKKIEFIIENKFKSTPTVDQLKLYDNFLNKTSQSALKYLMVFSNEQIPNDVKLHCDYNNWEIVKYFSFDENDTKSLVSTLENDTLENNKINIITNPKIKDFIDYYISYLSSYKDRLSPFINSTKYFSYNEIKEKLKTEHNDSADKENRFIGFQYLLYIQSEISKTISRSPLKIESTNDGGKNNIPGIAFWFSNFKNEYHNIDSLFFGIDGDSFKIGVSYKRQNYQNATKDVENIKTVLDLKKYSYLQVQENKNKLKEIDNNKPAKISSVFSLYSFKPIKDAEREQVTNDCAILINVFFKSIS